MANWYDTVVAHVTKVKAADWNSLITFLLDHAAEHKSAGDQPIKLDELAAPTNITTLNVSTSAHGLCPKLPDSATVFLNGTGAYSEPVGSGGGDVTGPASATANNLPKFADATGKVLSDSAVALANVVLTDDARLSDARTPSAHKTSHQDTGSDEIVVTGLSGLLADGQTPLAHKTSHQNDGSDELSVAGLSGLLADGQTPLMHKTSHQNAGGDEISVEGLSGLLADGQTPLAHNQSAATLTTGTLDGDRLPAMSTTKLGGVPATGTPAGKFLKDNGTFDTPAGTGGIAAPVSSTDNALVRFDGTGGATAQDSLITVDDTGNANIPTGKQYKVNGSQHVHVEADVTGLPAHVLDIVVQPIYLYPLSAIIPITNPELGELPVGQGELSNGINYIYLAFPDAVANAVIWKENVPADYASTTFTAQFECITTSSNIGTIKFNLSGIRVGAGSLNVTPLALTSAIISNTGSNQTLLSDETSAFSITGTGNILYLKLTRDYGTDTLPATARILSVRLTPVI